MRREVCVCLEGGGLQIQLFFQPSSEMHATCMWCIGVALPPYSGPALPLRKSDILWFKQTDGLSTEMVQLLGGEVLRNQMPPQHTGRMQFPAHSQENKTQKPTLPLCIVPLY